MHPPDTKDTRMHAVSSQNQGHCCSNMCCHQHCTSQKQNVAGLLRYTTKPFPTSECDLVMTWVKRHQWSALIGHSS